MTAEKQEKKAPEKIFLTEIEMLRGENIQLKIYSVQRELRELQEEQNKFKAQVENRLGIEDLQRYMMNRNGEGVLIGKD